MDDRDRPTNLSSLRIGQRVLSFSNDGLLVAEYGLFHSTGIVLHSTDPVSVREAGYMTTAAQALERLAQRGVTPQLADEAAQAFRKDVAGTFARADVVRALIGQLGAQELFDGAIFRAEACLYEGAWLDLRGVAAALPVANASLLLQALHLAASLAEVPADTVLNLSTAGVTRSRRPGERTFQRMEFERVASLPEQLRQVPPRTTGLSDPVFEERLRPVLLARVRERFGPHAHPVLRAHLEVLDKGLTSRTASEPPGAADLRTIEQQIDEGDATDLDARLAQLEAVRGATPAVRYLRARAALMRGQKAPRFVAQELSKLAEVDQGFHEADLGAARSWLAAGEPAHARHFARKVAEDPSVTDSKRLLALEILEATPATAERETSAVEARAELLPAEAGPRGAPKFPWLSEMPAATVPAATSLPPPPLESNGAAPVAPRPRMPTARYVPEIVEALSVPPGATENDLPLQATPTTPAQARIAMTRLARDLARDYRLWYGKTLRCDVMAIEAMQQHLLARFGGVDIADPDVAWELRRHGALLSEVIARALGGQWTDIAPSEPGYWTMRVPPGVRTCPVGRVYRFVSVGRLERDLVGHFLALDERARGA